MRVAIITGLRVLANMLNVRIGCIHIRGRMHRGRHKRMKRHEWVNVGRAERRRGKWRKEGFHRGRYLGEKTRERGGKKRNKYISRIGN